MGRLIKRAPWDAALLRSLRAGDCIAFVGAGFTGPIDMPLWRALIEHLIHVVGDSSNRPDLIEYAKVCVKEGQLPRAASAIRRADHKRLIDDQLKKLFDGDRLFTQRPKDLKK